jgi:Ca2+-binding EF-hand superfamily protein
VSPGSSYQPIQSFDARQETMLQNSFALFDQDADGLLTREDTLRVRPVTMNLCH